MTARARSPRAGWVLVELREGIWRRTFEGDREEAAVRRDAAIRVFLGVGPLSHPGHAVGLYDALGQPRDGFPAYPRLADGTRIRWPGSTPADGAVPEVRPMPPARPKTTG